MKQLIALVFFAFCFTSAQDIVGNGFIILNEPRQFGFNAENISALSSFTRIVTGMAQHPNGDIYYSDHSNCRVRKISAVTKRVNTVIGNGNCVTSGENVLGTAATIGTPFGLALDNDNNVLVGEISAQTIRKLNVQTGIVTRISGGGQVCNSNGAVLGDGGPILNARFCNPIALTVDTNNNIFVCDFSNNRIRKIDQTNNIVTTVVGTGLTGFNGDGPVNTVNVLLPTSVVLRSGELFLSSLHNLIRKIVNNNVVTIAGVAGVAAPSGENVPAVGSSLFFPGRMDFDSQGNLFFWEVANNGGGGHVRKIDAVTNTISTVAGGGNIFNFAQNTSALTFRLEFDPVQGEIICESDGNILIADFRSIIRVIGVAAPENQCGNGIVETGEDCDSAGPCCDTNCKFQPSSQACREPAGPCDVTEFCTGTSDACPSDAFAPTSTLCGQLFGVCEIGIPTSCTGTSATCPSVPTVLSVPQVVNVSSAVDMQWNSFSVVSFGNINGNTGRLQGRVASKNNISFGNGFSVADGLNVFLDLGQPFSLVAGNNLNWISGALFPNPNPFPLDIPEMGIVTGDENGFVGQVETVANFLEDQIVSPGCGVNSGCLNADFDTFQNYLGDTVQPYLASLSQNVNAFVQFSGLMIECSDNTSPLYVLNTDAATIASVTWYSVRGCNGFAAWIVNIKDEAVPVTFAGDNLPTISERTVFNILGSGRTINVQTLVNGNILSPKNTLSQTGGTINGNVYVGNVANVLDVALTRCTSFKTVIVTDFLAITVPVGANTITVVSGGNVFVGDIVTVGTQTFVVIAKTNNANGSATLTLSGTVTASLPSFSAVKFSFEPSNTGARLDNSNSLLIVEQASIGSSVVVSVILVLVSIFAVFC